MNWIERMYDLKGKDLYSQNGEGLLLEYVLWNIRRPFKANCYDIGGSDGFYLSNTKHVCQQVSYLQFVLDKENGHPVTSENILSEIKFVPVDLLSIDIDGNDYWILETIFIRHLPSVVIAEFNPAFTDSRTIKYNPDHVWDGTDYYGFTFEAGVKIADKHGYTVIFQVADMNMIMVRKDLIEGLYVPPVTFKQTEFFKKSERTDWVMI